MFGSGDCRVIAVHLTMTWSCWAQAAQQSHAGVVQAQPPAHTCGRSASAGWLPVLAQLQHSAGPASGGGQPEWAGWRDWVSAWQGVQPDAAGACWPGQSLVLHAGLWAALWVVEGFWVHGRHRGRAEQR